MTTPEDPGNGGGWRPPGDSNQPPPPPDTGPAPGQPQWGPPGQPPNYPPPPQQQWGGQAPDQWQSPRYGVPQVPNYLVWSILTTIFCCQPFGIVSIVFAAQANGKASGGDYAGAMEAARKAKVWAIAAGSVGGVIIIAYLIFIASVGMAAFEA